MKVVVLGATGNIGTAVVERLLEDGEVTSVVGAARRLPVSSEARAPGGRQVEWREVDVRHDDLRQLVEGADAVVHLAWMFQPTHAPDVTWETNVVGTARLLEAIQDTPVSRLVVASSVAAYSPRRSPAPVDESWPTHGPSAAAYAREKSYVERLLDHFQAAQPNLEVTRIRPAFVFQRRAASEQRRIFAGSLVPQRLVRPGLVPGLPLPDDLLLQAVHATDAADALVRAVRAPATGAFNVCADEVLDPGDLADLFGAARIRVPSGLLRGGLGAAWLARLVPADPRLFDAVLRIPMMSNARARDELGWQPTRSAPAVLSEFLQGLRERAGHGTAPLQPPGGSPEPQ